MFGSRNMLRMEERTEDQDYYWILEKAGLPYPEKLTIPRTLIVWLSSNFTTHKRNLSADSLPVPPTKSIKKIAALLAEGVIDQASLDGARIERHGDRPRLQSELLRHPTR